MDVSLRARLAKAGLDPDRTLPALRRAGLVDGDVDGRLLDLVSEAASPQDAMAVVADLAAGQPELFAAVRAEHDWLGRLVLLAGVSRPLGDLLVRFPDALPALRRLEPVDMAAVTARAEAAVVATDRLDEQAAAVAQIRRRATADIAVRDLAGIVAVDHIAAELAGLAEAVLTGVLAGLHRHVAADAPAARIGVIGMGKLGGGELNYVSDVDVVFVHAPAQADGDERAAADEARVVLERLLSVLNASTTMGRTYEVDPTLRPEGRAGALSRTVDSYVAYWRRWAQTWEFQALVKARPVAGDRELSAELLRRAEPFVYPEHLDPAVVAEIRHMKGRVEATPEAQRHGARQVKLGPGGLRDIEFAVQLLQLVHGRADRSLRVTGTLAALAALARGGYVADADADSLATAYRRLRAIEHRLQLAHERRTHTIPDDEERQEWLARSLGYRAAGGDSARSRFLADLARVQADVRDLHAKLFYRPLLEMHASVAAADAGLSLPDEVRDMGEAAALERLRALGFRDARAALRDVRVLTAGVTRRARTLQAVLPAVLNTLQASPDPDGGLAGFRRLVEAHGPGQELLSHLRDHPPAADLLARVLGTSTVAADLLVDQPQGVEWLRDGQRDHARGRDELARAALARLSWQDTTAALRRFKRHELLRVVIRDVAGDASVSNVGEELTALAEACLEAALAAEVAAQAGATGAGGRDDLPVRLAVVGMGKLGGRELHYVSDLDVVFVHEPVAGADDAEATRLALRISEQVMTSLSRITAEGTAFEVDADLRPEGRSGPLSRSLASYLAYYDRWAEPWEHQALLKARAVAGDGDLGERFGAAVRPLAYPPGFAEREAQQLRRIKARVERERLGKRVDPRRHLKLGPGGLTDVEWTVQLLQRRHGHAAPLVRTTSTMVALDALQDDSILDHRDAAWLRDGYRFLSRVRNRLYLMGQRNVDVLPSDPGLLERLARGLGYGGGRQEVEGEHLRHTRHVRRVTERVFYATEPSFALFGGSH